METSNTFSPTRTYRKAMMFQCKSIDDSTGEMEGYGSVFNVVDYVDEQVMPGAFAKSLEEHRANKTFPAMLRDHDISKVVGVYTDIEEDGVGLKLRGKFAMDVQVARETHSIVKMYHENGQAFGLSIGYQVLEWEKAKDNRDVVNLTKLDLREVSIVPFPCLAVARVTGVKFTSEEPLPTERDFEKMLREQGFSRSQARDVCERGYKALLNPKEEANNEVVEALAQLKSLMTKGTL